jgi:hypothetical protein
MVHIPAADGVDPATRHRRIVRLDDDKDPEGPFVDVILRLGLTEVTGYDSRDFTT